MSWSWSAGSAELSAWNHTNRVIDTCVELGLVTFTAPRTVTVSTGLNRESVMLQPGTHVTHARVPVSLVPGQNTISLETDQPAQAVGNGDPRPIAFGVQNAVVCSSDRTGK